MDIITTFSAQEITRQNKCQMNFLDKLIREQDIDKTLMINAITCSMLESSCNFDYDKVYNNFSKSTVLEPTIKHFMKQISLCRRAARNLVSK